MVLCARSLPDTGIPGADRREIIGIQLAGTGCLAQGQTVVFQGGKGIGRAGIHIKAVCRQIRFAGIHQPADQIVGLHRRRDTLCGRQLGIRRHFPEPEFADHRIGNGRIIGEDDGHLAIRMACCRDGDGNHCHLSRQGLFGDQGMRFFVGADDDHRFDSAIAILVDPGEAEGILFFRIQSGCLKLHALFIEQHRAGRSGDSRECVGFAANGLKPRLASSGAAAIEIAGFRQSGCSLHGLRQRMRPFGEVGSLERAQHQRMAFASLPEGQQQVVGAAADGTAGNTGLADGRWRIQSMHIRPGRPRKDGSSGQRPHLLDPHGCRQGVFQTGPQFNEAWMQGELQQQGWRIGPCAFHQHPVGRLFNDPALIAGRR